MINSVCLIGNLAADPDIRSTQSGNKVAKMRIAVNEYWTNRQTGQRNEKTHWIPLNAWDKLAEICERYLHRGMKIAVRGSLDYQEWTTSDGQKRSRIEVRVRDLEMLTPKNADSYNRGGQDQGRYAAPPSSQAQRAAPPQAPPQQQPGSYSAPVDNSGGYAQQQPREEYPPIEDEDIPF